ncbi:unnamed protein product [Prunus armeniaca]|uniref:Uncharacterized protein n=1 Tax=Prunus armeniaca TaxID=36596 RepID=A0A6J5UAW7_PRUAR|nr:unnamed protein product [Prunus armeniaca]
MCVIAENTFKKKEGNGTVAIFEKGSTSSTKPNQKEKGKFKTKKKKKGKPTLKPKEGVKKKQEEDKEVRGGMARSQVIKCGDTSICVQVLVEEQGH